LLRDFKLSDDISLRFSNSEWAEYPLFADKYINWIDVLPQEEQVINIFMELSSLGMAQPLSSNILEFLKALPECAKAKGIGCKLAIKKFVRFETGEGLEKKNEDFAAEVAAQMAGN
jgi:alpha-amylase/alpha-mannosidase (GH57 family)